MNKLLIVTTREYLRNVKKVTFWIATLFFPLFIILAGLVSGLSGKVVEDSITKSANEAENIIVSDAVGVINKDLLKTDVYKNVKLIDNKEEGVNKIKSGEADVFISIPQDFYTSKNIQLYQQSKGIFAQGAFTVFADSLIKQSILQEVNNEDKIKIYNSTFIPEIISYKNGQVVDDSIVRLVVPGIAVIIYFILLSFANSYLLASVSEEKENRMIEIVLTSIDSRSLIIGKILGQVATVFTQLLVLVTLGGIGLFFVKDSIGGIGDILSKITISPWTVVMAVFYMICGFMILGNIMVGVGASVPNYKDAQSFSSVFIILSILPIYFVTIILADPNGLVSQIVSYFPLTSAMILLLRYTLGELQTWEIIFTSVLLIIYVAATFGLAIKLFEFGSLEYSNRISIKNFWKTLRA